MFIPVYNFSRENPTPSQRDQVIDFIEKNGGLCRIRTCDPLIKSYPSFVIFQYVIDMFITRVYAFHRDQKPV